MAVAPEVAALANVVFLVMDKPSRSNAAEGVNVSPLVWKVSLAAILKVVPEVTNRSCALAGKQAMLESKTKSRCTVFFIIASIIQCFDSAFYSLWKDKIYKIIYKMQNF